MNRYRLAFIAISAALLLGACGGSSDDSAADDTSSDEIAAEETSTTTTTVAPTTTVEEKVGELVPDADWSTIAADLRGRDGEQFRFECPTEGSAASIWGIELYTDDSSVCTAAVHVGLLSFEDGGEVVIEIAGGEESYPAGSANDLESRAWPSWGGSFFFPDAPPGTGEFLATTAEPGSSGWAVEVINGAAIGSVVEVDCEAGGSVSGVWGSNPYTADGSICSAAVHAGLITAEDGGVVTATVSAGEESYTGSEANGVTSADWPSYDTSFVFPDVPIGNTVTTEAEAAEEEPAEEEAPADEDAIDSWAVEVPLGAEVGTTFEVDCAPGGSVTGVWGSGPYTAEASICSAAVHAGVITAEDGGFVTATVTDGEESYTGSEANGVTSNNWPAYDTSFTVS